VADARLTLLAALAASAMATGCRPPGVPVEHADLPARARVVGGGPGGWGVRHAPRAHLRITLPDAPAWRVSDAGGDVVGEHAATSGRLLVKQTIEHEVVGRAQCEARARALDLVPDAARLRSVDVEDIKAPGEFDTRVMVAIDPGPGEGAPVTGWVLAFGGHLRRCLLLRYETKVASSRDEVELSTRLAAVRGRVVPEIELEPVLEPVIPRAPRGATSP